MVDIPLVDITAWTSGTAAERGAVVQQLDGAFSTSGFALVTGHGMDPALAATLRAESQAFLTDPDEAKAACRAEALGRPGWIPIGMEANGYTQGMDTPPDLKESLSFQPGHLPAKRGLMDDGAWALPRPALKAAAEAWMTAADDVFMDLLRICGVAIGRGEAFFADGCARAPHAFYVNWYPPTSRLGAPKPGQYRIGPHTDFGILTVLDRQLGQGGLQVQLSDGTWVDAPYVPGALTINVANLLTLWSGGRWISAMHRVLPPPVDAPDESLMSLVYFGGADSDLLVEPLDGRPPVRAGDFLQAQVDAISVTG